MIGLCSVGHTIYGLASMFNVVVNCIAYLNLWWSIYWKSSILLFAVHVVVTLYPLGFIGGYVILCMIVIPLLIKVPVYPWYWWLVELHCEVTTLMSVLLSGTLLKFTIYVNVNLWCVDITYILGWGYHCLVCWGCTFWYRVIFVMLFTI